jgi:hypothetical protein
VSCGFWPQGKFPSSTIQSQRQRKRVGILFGIIFGVETGLIALCSTLLARRGLGLWIPIAIAIIVGVHFLPPARVFEVQLYYWTGSLSVLGVLGCLLISDLGTRLLCVGLVMGCGAVAERVASSPTTRPAESASLS